MPITSYKTKGVLVLADGTIFEGISVGATGYHSGEVVFNTAQTGYQEILSDPSYAEQMIVFTQPHIGNVGVNSADMESDQVYAKGVIMRSMTLSTSNWRAEESLEKFLLERNIIALSEIDTRALTLHLRQYGSQAGCMMTEPLDVSAALRYAKAVPAMLGADLAQQVSTKKIYERRPKGSAKYHVVIYDFGIKRSTIEYLLHLGCRLSIVPARTLATEVLEMKPDGVLLSNGPGDPAACYYAIQQTKILLQQAIPLMGICLGHQLLALASGGTTKKMRFGHHGANHPIRCLSTGTVSISSQNHGFVVAEESLPSCLAITHRSLFDNSIAGIKRLDVPAFAFQGHPEAGPGPTELTVLFNQFIAMLEVSHAKTN